MKSSRGCLRRSATTRRIESVGRGRKCRAENDGRILLKQRSAGQLVDSAVTEYGVNASGSFDLIAIPVHLAKQGVGVLQADRIGHRLMQSRPDRLDIVGANASIHR